MFDFNLYSVIIIPLICFVLYTICSRLQRPLSEQKHDLLSSVPSITKTIWSKLKLLWVFGTKKPTELLPLYMELVKKHGPIFQYDLMGRSYVILNDPNDLKIILSSVNHINKGPEYDTIQPWLNEGLLLSSGSKWYNRRKLLTKAFHFKSLHYYNASMNRHARVLVKKLLEASTNNDGVDIREYVTSCAFDLVFESIMGTEMNTQEDKSVEYIHYINHACESAVKKNFKFWLWNDVIYKISAIGRQFYKAIKVLHDYTDEIIINKKNMLKNNKEIRKLEPDGKTLNQSFLDLLLKVLIDHPDEMTNEDIREEIDTFLFEGHDTSSSALTMTMIMLGMYQDVQENVRDELLSIFGDSDRDASIADLNDMKYLDAVIRESLRLYPSVPFFSRKLEAQLDLTNYSIPPNTIVAIFPYIVHRNEELYSNPEEFDPERFLVETNKDVLLFGYIPFSAGPRNCIGQKYAMYQIKTVLSTILRKTKIETLAKKEDILVSMELVLRLRSSIKMKFYAI